MSWLIYNTVIPKDPSCLNSKIFLVLLVFDVTGLRATRRCRRIPISTLLPLGVKPKNRNCKSRAATNNRLHQQIETNWNWVFFVIGESKVKWSEVAQSCPTLRDPMDCSLPGSSAHGIFQARTLEWVAIAFSEPNLRSVINTPQLIIHFPIGHFCSDFF